MNWLESESESESEECRAHPEGFDRAQGKLGDQERERERERGRGVGLEVIRPRSSRLYSKEDLIPVFGLSRG